MNQRVLAGNHMYKGTLDGLMQTWRNEGFFALYKGFWPNWLRLGPWNIIVSFISKILCFRTLRGQVRLFCFCFHLTSSQTCMAHYKEQVNILFVFIRWYSAQQSEQHLGHYMCVAWRWLSAACKRALRRQLNVSHSFALLIVLKVNHHQCHPLHCKKWLLV